MQTVKCVCVGDGAVGKTSLLMSYSQEKFPTEYVPTIFDNFSVNQIVEGVGPVSLNLWDTAGQAEYDQLRMLSYPETDVVLICFAVHSLASYENIRHKWAPEVRDNCSDTPIVLVALQSDRRTDGDKEIISQSSGYSLQREIGAIKYMECSACTGDGMKSTFEEVIRLAITGPPKENSDRGCCTIL